MLKLKPTCEHCDKALPANSAEAMICSFECTFCCDCVEAILFNVCPNCGGGFVPRPIRPQQEWFEGVSLAQYPATTEKVFKPVDPEAHRAVIEAIRNIKPENR